MTSVTLPSDLQAWAELEVAGGRAESLDTLIATALAARKAHLEYVRARLDEARRSEPLDGDAFLVEMDSWVVEDAAAVG